MASGQHEVDSKDPASGDSEMDENKETINTSSVSKSKPIPALVRRAHSTGSTVSNPATPNSPGFNENIDPELLVKHPLQNTWALWFYKTDRQKSWKESQRFVSKFSYVEEFWALVNHIQPAAKLQNGCDYSVFKVGIEPMWEDEQNKCGGRWLINLHKGQRATDLDKFWLELLLCMIGEAFDSNSDDIRGAVVQIRNKGDKIALWLGDAENREAVLGIGKKFKERLNLPPGFTIGFEAHADTMSKTGSIAKNSYTL